MPCICYVPKNFHPKQRVLIDKANVIIEEYAQQGYDLTLRQLYYQMVSRDIIPNTLKSYKALGSVINDARLAGLIDWDRIQDLTRELRSLSHWSNPAEIVAAAASSYRLDLWANQTWYPEVWIEKDALRNVVERVCNANDVPFFACRGYTSQSELWGAAMRLIHKGKNHKIIIFHLGDHDPSGMDMTRDIEDRLAMFGCSAIVKRLALNMNQVEEYNPPPNPAKTTDVRFQKYADEFGEESWELDALTPEVITEIIQKEIDAIREIKVWRKDLKQMNEEKATLQKSADHWPEVVEYLEEQF